MPGLYLVALFFSAMLAGLLLRALRIPLDYYRYAWGPLVYIAEGFRWLAVLATVLVLPWIVSEYLEKPAELHSLAFFGVTLLGYVIGAQPSNVFYEWLVDRQSRKHRAMSLFTPSSVR